MHNTIDARGVACPGPVLMAKKAVDEAPLQSVAIVVDNIASMENVSRFFASRSFGVDVVKEEGTFKIIGTPSKESPVSPVSAVTKEIHRAESRKIMVLAATDKMGSGDDDLGKKLMISFIKTLREMGDDLWRLVFVNNGVKLTIEGSPVLEELLLYEAEGMKILVCGTCLTHFNLMDAKKVGETTNMLDIVTAMQLADKVIQL
ncbi:MAG: sulfurtransferase-like selenium metabolism protein YedF [Desulfamplus sp.]|nr:sulfurtransferase-like selenium metabolism protein YedF [Desulfamplus sp.]